VIDGVPEGWERVPFEEALVLQRGFDLPVQDREDGVVPIYSSTGICGHHSKSMVKGPGVVTGRSGTLGVVQYAAEDFWPLNTALWVREFKRVSPIYAFFLLQELGLEQYNGGASVPTLDRKAVHRLPVLIPSRRLVDMLDEYVVPMFELLQSLRSQNEKLRAARDLLLPRLMSGEIAV
jgi:type I restriction enzyme S subunit